jgi:hypothetical protein
LFGKVLLPSAAGLCISHDRRAARQDGVGRNSYLTSVKAGIGSWFEAAIADYLATGFTPDYNSFGDTNFEVQVKMAKLTYADRVAIAPHLKAVPGVE